MSQVEVTCPRCGGSGVVPRFGHIAKGVCFICYGAGKVKRPARADGQARHECRLGGYNPDGPADPPCCICGLPASQWPPVVPAVWYDGLWLVYLPVPGMVHRQMRFEGSRRKAQNAARAAILAEFPTAVIKWRAA